MDPPHPSHAYRRIMQKETQREKVNLVRWRPAPKAWQLETPTPNAAKTDSLAPVNTELTTKGRSAVDIRCWFACAAFIRRLRTQMMPSACEEAYLSDMPIA